ncbi:hypothetical protein J4734_05845 [Klebsiella pneumoniae]|uniref:Uncharacterized protein n=1 Tax=Klebsiella pneumoniae TaxID=573 RepID=A0A939NS53_KLEPN|nr:hypothetical protein [Klebsiella pneumoniae]
MLKAMRLYGAFATLNVRFSNDKLLSMGMPNRRALPITSTAAWKPPAGCRSLSKWPSTLNNGRRPARRLA